MFLFFVFIKHLIFSCGFEKLFGFFFLFLFVIILCCKLAWRRKEKVNTE